MLPTNEHPYDHFLLTGKIVFDKPLEHVSDIKYLYKYKPYDISSSQIKKI